MAKAQDFYYANGKQIFISRQTGAYVVNFRERNTPADRENFLSNNRLTAKSGDLRYSDYILIEVRAAPSH